MIYEVTRSNGLPLFFQGLDKKKNYTIKVSIILENNDYVENYKDFTIAIDDWDLSFFDRLVKLNEEEIVRFKDSKKFERRV
ncbi:MAG: hypothetical protein RXO36_07480 [Candidatus Nanopusillus acidilobi]